MVSSYHGLMVSWLPRYYGSHDYHAIMVTMVSWLLDTSYSKQGIYPPARSDQGGVFTPPWSDQELYIDKVLAQTVCLSVGSYMVIIYGSYMVSSHRQSVWCSVSRSTTNHPLSCNGKQHPENKTHWNNVGLMLVQRRKWWTNIKTTLVRCVCLMEQYTVGNRCWHNVVSVLVHYLWR